MRLEHTGFLGARAVAVSFLLGSGWAKMLDGRLPALLAQDPTSAVASN
jgi:hypothetical protein